MDSKLFLAVFLLGGWWSHSDGCWDQERTALMHLKPYFNPYVHGVNKWGEEENCCEWANVECDISTGRVTRLFLYTFNADFEHGFFEDPIVRDALGGWEKREEWYLNVSLFLPFQELNTLSLRGNKIAGFVHHQEKGEMALSKLEVLDLYSNLFNNSILPFLGLLPNLMMLDISYNRLEGDIYTGELNALNNLEELNMPGNQVFDFVPSQDNETQLRLMNLKTLDLSYNPFNSSRLASLGRLSNLKSLFLGVRGPNLTGSIDLTELKALTHLEDLSLYCYDYSTDWNCSLPLQSLGLFPSLKTVSLVGFDIEGTGMTSENNETELRLMNLKTLDLSEIIFNSSILASLGRLTNLKSLFLGVRGPNFTGSIDLTELNALKHLEDLSLYCYYSPLKTTARSPCSLPLQSLGLFPSLKTVSLRGFDIEGTITEWHSNFTNLEDLEVDFSSLPTNFLGSIGQFTSLKRLRLWECEMNGSLNILEGEWHSNFTNLEELEVVDSFLQTNILGSIRQFTSLKRLALSGCEMNGSLNILEGEWHSNFTNLEELDVYASSLPTNFLGSIGQFTSLKRLSLRECKMNGSLNILDGLCEMTNLRGLDLSANNLKGSLPECFSNLTSLETLDLSSNQIRVPISLGPLFNLSKLKHIYADNNIMYVETQIPSSAPRFQLELISLSCCGCGDVGSFPEFLYHQHHLQSLDLSNIFFKGNQFPSWLLDNNTKLETLFLTNTSLSGPLQLPLASHKYLSRLDISNNFFNGSIPTGIGEQLPSLEFLNMSKTHSTATIPSSFGHTTPLRVLDLSNNKLEGEIFSGIFKLPNLRELKLDGNNLSGRIPDLLPQSPFLLALDVSNNTLSGTIPKWMGNMSSLRRIIMSNNHLQGSIPIEFCQLHSLVLLDLSVNNISGSIPSCFNPSQITQIHLAKNRLRGALPNALRNSSTLVTLDIRENFLSGSIPSWIGGLSNLSYLLLSKNNFQGEIPMGLCNLNYLSVMDLSHNKLSGHIPTCLKLTTLGDVHYVNETTTGGSVFSLDEAIDFSIKNGYYSYRGRIIPMISGIDLSCNKLVGEIPHQIGNLQKILVLNLSHNSLTGPIPPTFANLKQIESLDLSYNKLSGNIPSQLVGLTFLSDFNVSFNNLSGRTPPRDAQFGIFDEDSYMRNPFLCGEPLPKCAETGPSPPKPNSSTDNDEVYGFIDMGAFRMTFIVSYTIMFLAVVTVLYINPYWRRVWFYHAENAATFCYYFVLDNVLLRRFHCGNL